MSLVIMVLEDEEPVRQAVVRDLEPFEQAVRVEPCEDVADARELLKSMRAAGDSLAVVVSDHRMPGDSGVDFLVEISGDEALRGAGKILLTGQADQDDTIRALNQANLDHFLAKPWEPEQLREVVRTQLTNYVLAAGIDPLPYMAALDGQRIMEVIARRGLGN